MFNSAQYFATVLFAPIMGWITHAFGWPYVFYFMGAVGIVVSGIWLKVIHSPREHPRINKAEFDFIEQGGALVDMDRPKKETRLTEAELELDYVEQADVEPGVVKKADILPAAGQGASANAAPKLPT